MFPHRFVYFNGWSELPGEVMKSFRGRTWQEEVNERVEGPGGAPSTSPASPSSEQSHHTPTSRMVCPSTQGTVTTGLTLQSQARINLPFFRLLLSVKYLS